MSQPNIFQQQPKGFFLLAFTQLWESFSFFGMRVLLVLYLTSQLAYSEGDSFALYAIYTTMIELGALVGGFLADRFLGLRGSVTIGAIVIGLGHIVLSMSVSPEFFFLGLGAIICGSTLFRVNLKALLGLLYEKDDKRRDIGYTLLYSGSNFGGFAAAVICGLVASVYGWHAGFGLAALGMLIGVVYFIYKREILPKDTEQKRPISRLLVAMLAILSSVAVALLLQHFHHVELVMVPAAAFLFLALLFALSLKIEPKNILKLAGVLFALIIFFVFEELMCSLLIVYCENQVERSFMGMQIPSSVLAATNPLVIILCGPILSKLIARFQLSLAFRLALSFLFMTLGFFMLYLHVGGRPEALDVVVSYTMIAIGELFIAPSVFAFCSKVSPKNNEGLTMSAVTTAFALANLLSGQLSQVSGDVGVFSFTTLFLMITMLSGVVFVVLSVCCMVKGFVDKDVLTVSVA